MPTKIELTDDEVEALAYLLDVFERYNDPEVVANVLGEIIKKIDEADEGVHGED